MNCQDGSAQIFAKQEDNLVEEETPEIKYNLH
jgi:hypothetical protein